MPIFARRRLRAMVDDVSRLTKPEKVNDLLARLESRKTRDAMAAEAELAMLWAISQVADITVEPVVGGGRQPDALSRGLFASGSAVVEVRALSDDSFSGREDMVRTANIVASTADRFAKHAGSQLAFEFRDRSWWDGRYRRKRCVDPNFEMSAGVEEILRSWVLQRQRGAGSRRLRITEGRTDLVVTWTELPMREPSVFCSMPPVAYDLEDNPVYKALRKKSRQIRNAGAGHLRVVFLFDAGCQLLWDLNKHRYRVREIGAEAIIEHALGKLSGIDVVCVFSPFREGRIGSGRPRKIVWKVVCFDRRMMVPESEYARLELLAGKLPRARFEGYQARDLHRQGGFLPGARGWYRGTRVFFEDGAVKIRISSRLLQEYLAGRLEVDGFRRAAFGNDDNRFEMWLQRGETIQGASFEPGGIDEDDDVVVLELGADWAAKPLRE